jgi:hypothetical protein
MPADSIGSELCGLGVVVASLQRIAGVRGALLITGP